jgi:hypothetical protein
MSELFFMRTIAASKQCETTANVDDNIEHFEEIENQPSEHLAELAEYERQFKTFTLLAMTKFNLLRRITVIFPSL